MDLIEVKADNISKRFVRNNNIFSNFTINVINGEIIGLIGENGSGKSTLMKILAGILTQSSGKLEYYLNRKLIEKNLWNKHYAYVAPYVNLYEEFTPLEHYKVIADIRDIPFDENQLDEDLEYFKLYKYKYTTIKNFSSGMKQRYKFILANQSNSEILYLDEPTSNLDENGINKVFQLIEKKISNNGTVVIATNEERERDICTQLYNIMEYKIFEREL